MNFALVYIINRFFYLIGDFFHHWYFHATRTMVHGFVSFFENLDRTFAVRITLRHFFEPLYKDYSILGRILGVIFRSGRVLIGGVIYLFFVIIFLGVYLAWLLIPPGIIIYAARNI